MTPKQAALQQLEVRRTLAQQLPRKNNARLAAGSSRYYYCKICGLLVDTFAKEHVEQPQKYCVPCEELKKKGWL